MLKKIALGIVALVVVLALVFGILIALQPDDFSVERSKTMEVPAAVTFEKANDFRKWEEWSPWADKDPNMEVTFDGAPNGVGAIFEWSGNEDVGAGRMTITESRPNEYIEYKLEFFEPDEPKKTPMFETTTAFEFASQDADTTEVTWKMFGEVSLMGKVAGLFMDMEDMIGKDYETGLANMEEAALAASSKAAAGDVADEQ